MKKIVPILLVLSMLLTAYAALAEGMGVQIIGGPALASETVSLDDFKLNKDVEIDGYGVLNASECEYLNQIFIKGEGGWPNSGKEAEYLVLRMNIVNTQYKAKDYLENASVKVEFDGAYEFGGWFYQYDYDISTKIDSVVDKSRSFAIDPMYQGHYMFGCTLPNAVVESTKPLKMFITIDGNEITYNIRK